MFSQTTIPISTMVPMAMAMPDKRNDIGIDAEQLHRDEDHQHGQRQQAGDQQRAAQVHDHDQDDDDGDEDFLDQGRVQRAERFMDQPVRS